MSEELFSSLIFCHKIRGKEIPQIWVEIPRLGINAGEAVSAANKVRF